MTSDSLTSYMFRADGHLAEHALRSREGVEYVFTKGKVVAICPSLATTRATCKSWRFLSRQKLDLQLAIPMNGSLDIYPWRLMCWKKAATISQLDTPLGMVGQGFTPHSKHFISISRDKPLRRVARQACGPGQNGD